MMKTYAQGLLVLFVCSVAFHAQAYTFTIQSKLYTKSKSKTMRLLATWNKKAGCRVVAKRTEKGCRALMRRAKGKEFKFTWKEVSRSGKGLMRDFKIQYTCSFKYHYRAFLKKGHTSEIKGNVGRCTITQYRAKKCPDVNKLILSTLKKNRFCKAPRGKLLNWTLVGFTRPPKKPGPKTNMTSMYGVADEDTLKFRFECEWNPKEPQRWE